MTIIARIKQSGEDGGQDSSEAVLEKYYEAKRELETLKQRVGSEYEDEIERLTAAKKSLEKKVGTHSCMGGWCSKVIDERLMKGDPL